MKNNNLIIIAGLVLLTFLSFMLYSYLDSKKQQIIVKETSTTTSVVIDNTNPNWINGSSSGISFQYPETLGAKYISTSIWPPTIQILNKTYSCATGDQKTLGGITFCETKTSEGAAGSVYVQYSYAFPSAGKTYVMTFTTREVQCANYSDPQMSECNIERSSFNIDTIIGGIAQSIR